MCCSCCCVAEASCGVLEREMQEEGASKDREAGSCGAADRTLEDGRDLEGGEGFSQPSKIMRLLVSYMHCFGITHFQQMSTTRSIFYKGHLIRDSFCD